MFEITKYQELPSAVKKFFEENDYKFEAGATYIANKASIVRINKITFDKKRKPVDNYSIKIYYQEAKDWDCTEWTSERSENPHNFEYSYKELLKLERPIKEYWSEALDFIENKKNIKELEYQAPETNMTSETGLIHRGSKASLIAIQNGLEERKTKAELMARFVGYEMEKRKQELDGIRKRLNEIVADFEKEIVKIMKVITTIELYLGINEELFQIQDGNRAPSDTPITFRQQVLYMDEEIGHWKNGGLDYSNIDWFDKWLTVPENLHQVFPEKKGLVVFRPRRNRKDYGDNIIANAFENAKNLHRTYLLIRNGDCLYRVFTENIEIQPRLFPLRKEFQELLEKVEKEMKDAEGWSNEKEQKDKSKAKFQDTMYEYRKRAILMQGLIDRSDVFHPLPAEKVDIFKLDKLGNKVQFIYDDESTLPSGRKSFFDWVEDINKKITVGSRIILTGEYGRLYSEREHNYSERWYRETRGGRKVTYDMPPAGVYEVSVKFIDRTTDIPHYYIDELEKKGLLIKKGTVLEERFSPGYGTYSGNEFKLEKNTQVRTFKGKHGTYIEAYECTFKEEHLVIYYNPKGTVYTWDGDWHERKNKVAFRVFRDDDFVLNYDQISLEDINFYLKSRVDRPNYLEMMPILIQLKDSRLKELESEKSFVRFIINRNYKNLAPLTDNEVEGRVWECIRWWKYKNQWKRPIKKDDTLALRMIEKRLLSKNYHTFEKYEVD